MKNAIGKAVKRRPSASRADGPPEAVVGILWKIFLKIWPLDDDDATETELGKFEKFFFALLGSCTFIWGIPLAGLLSGGWSSLDDMPLLVGNRNLLLMLFVALPGPLFAYMVSRGKISRILRAYFRGMLAPALAVTIIFLVISKAPSPPADAKVKRLDVPNPSGDVYVPGDPASDQSN